MSKKLLEYSVSLFFIVSSFSIILVMVYAKSTLDYYMKATEVRIQTEREIIQSANEIREIVVEGGIALAVRALEKNGVIPPTDADQLVLESIGRIEKKSERLGKIAKYVNDQIKKER